MSKILMYWSLRNKYTNGVLPPVTSRCFTVSCFKLVFLMFVFHCFFLNPFKCDVQSSSFRDTTLISIYFTGTINLYALTKHKHTKGKLKPWFKDLCKLLGLVTWVFYRTFRPVHLSQTLKHASVTHVFCNDVKTWSLDKVKNSQHTIPLKPDQEGAVSPSSQMREHV
jgi:hypothetical protein